MFKSVDVISPRSNTIYQELDSCLIMVASRNLYRLEISPDGTTWYGRFGQKLHYYYGEHYHTDVGGTITFYVPRNWYWRYSQYSISTSAAISPIYWLKFVFNF
jgi:hypothetical protein